MSATVTVKSRGKMQFKEQFAAATQEQDYNRAPVVSNATASKSKNAPILLTGAQSRFSSTSKKFDPYFVYMPMFRIAGKIDDVRAFLVNSLSMTPENATKAINTQTYNYQNYQSPTMTIQIRDPTNPSNAITVSAKAAFDDEIARRKAAHPTGAKSGPSKDLHLLIRWVHSLDGKTTSASGAVTRSARSATLPERLASIMPSASDPRGHWLNVTDFKGDMKENGSMKGATKAPIPKGRSATFAQIDPSDPELSRVVFDPTKLDTSPGAYRFLVRYLKEQRGIEWGEKQAYDQLRLRHAGAEPPAPVQVAPSFGSQAPFIPQGNMAPPAHPPQFPTHPLGQAAPQFTQHQQAPVAQLPQFQQPQQVQFTQQQPQFTQPQQPAMPQFTQPQQVQFTQQPQFTQPQQPAMPQFLTTSPKVTQLPKMQSPSKMGPVMLPPQIATPSGLTSKVSSPKFPASIPNPTELVLPSFGVAQSL